MALILVFAISGLALALLIYEKARTMRKGRRSFALRLISKGDERFSELAHRGARAYADSREELIFLLRKQLPLRAKNIYNKSSAAAKEKVGALMVDIRGSRLLKKSDGLSEFFQALSEKEKNLEAGSEERENEVD